MSYDGDVFPYVHRLLHNMVYYRPIIALLRGITQLTSAVFVTAETTLQLYEEIAYTVCERMPLYV